MMSSSSRRRAAALVLVLATLAVTGAPAGAQVRPTDPVDPRAIEPGPDQPTADGAPITGSKATSSTLAETDPDLLARTDGAAVEVMIKLDYDAIAVYGGGRDGLAATSPSVTGEPLTRADTTTGPYARQVARDEASVVADIRAAVPSAEIGQSLRVVYGGVAARIPAASVEAVLAVDGVVAVQEDRLEQLLTDATPAFVGAEALWPQIGGRDDAGRGVLFGSLDSGLWPEHPSLADDGSLPAPPAKADGTPRACQYGDNPLTPATDVFACNDKLIGGQAFMATYNSLVGDDVYVDLARDSNGHGTHTATTAAGNAVASATILGIERGPISGLAPGAWVSGYKVCGPNGCYGSDSTAAIEQAILDGVDVINYSISGGSEPATDPVELAFLDAYAAGVFVAASAGNSGPGAGTVDHRGPWTTTVAATSPNRDLATTLTVAGTTPLALPGLSLTAGVPTPSPIVLASAPPYSDARCTTPAPPGLFTGKIVACERSPGRVLKGFNVKQGGAAGMVLYNAAPTDVSADNHWLPTVHVADGPALLAHLAANPGTTASFPQGVATPATGDEMAIFSSRGPGGLVIKPDVAAPGRQVVAGNTPTPEEPNLGPPGEYFRSIDGTSMAAPHVAGAALLLRDAHPDWTPGQIRSALTGSAVPVTDGGSPASPFATGSGRIQIDAAATPGLLLDETAARFTTLGSDPIAAVHLNLAQVSAPAMPGRLRTTRTVTNPGATATYGTSTTTGPGTTITVEPSTFTLGPGESQELAVTITTAAVVGTQQTGAIVLAAPGRNDTRLPVAFTVAPSEVTMTGLGCTPDPITAPATSTCSYELANDGYADALVDLRAEGDATATVTGADLGATTSDGVATAQDVVLDGITRGVPATAPATGTIGYIPLDTFGVEPVTLGDEQLVNYNVPGFVYAGQTYARVGITSNGYLVVGGGTNADLSCCPPPSLGDPARPNDVLAPFWTDLDGTGNDGVFVTSLTDGVSSWLVVEWRLNVYGTSSARVFQTWIGLNGSEDVSFAYDPGNLPAAPPAGYGLLVGAENADGAGTSTLAPGTAPTEDLRVTSSAEVPSGTVRWDVTVRGAAGGTAEIEAEATSNRHPGSVVAVNQLEVGAEPLPVVTDDPDDLTVDALETASFTAAATGGSLARWERLPAGGATWETVPGATGSPLTFTAHGADDGDRYRAVFANVTGGETTSDPATLTVERLASTTSVSVSPATPVRGQDVTFTAEVGPSTATGTVQFALDGTPVGGPVAVAGGEATSSAVPDVAAGPHTVTAAYSGDGDHEGSDDDTDFDVTRNASTTVVVDVDPDTIVVGDDVVVDVDVTPAPQGGTVQLAVDGTDTGAPVTVSPTTGEGTATLTGIGVGPHTIVATFSGDDDLDGSSSTAVPITVAKRATTTTIGVTPATPVRGQDVTLTATVAPATGTGTVQFTLDGDPFGSPAAVTGGLASVVVPDLAAGEHTVGAAYSGDGEHLGSDDGDTVTVLRNASTTTIVEITAGIVGEDTPVDATITVVPAPVGGTVQLSVDGVPYGAPLALDAGGSVETTLTGLAPGSRTVLARFSGDDDLDPSEDEVDLTVYAAEEAFVRRAYQVVFGRNGDETGVAYWVGRIESGLDRTTLIDRFTTSAEGRGRLVGRVYATALDRTPSADDRAYWSGRVAAGLTAEDLLATLLASREGFLNAGAHPAGFAEKLYDAHLVRTPSEAEVEYWSGRASSVQNIAQLRQLARQFGRMPEATQVALVETARLVCGTTTFPPGVADQLRARWLAHGRNPLRLAGDTLALLCPSSSAPPT